MAASKQDEPQASKYFDEVKAAQKPEKSTVGKLVDTLRSDMVPASDVEPAKEPVFRRETLRPIAGIILGAIVLSFIFFLAIGPGRPILEHNLSLLANQVPTPSRTATQTRVAYRETSTPPKPAPTASPTKSPTDTPVVHMMASPTQPSSTPSVTVVTCRDALSITLSDVGQVLCVRGVILETVSNPTNFMVIFSNKKNAFYWVSYDLVWSQAKLNTCYQTSGKIEQIGNAPLLVFNYKNLPKVCQ